MPTQLRAMRRGAIVYARCSARWYIDMLSRKLSLLRYFFILPPCCAFICPAYFAYFAYATILLLLIFAIFRSTTRLHTIFTLFYAIYDADMLILPAFSLYIFLFTGIFDFTPCSFTRAYYDIVDCRAIDARCYLCFYATRCFSLLPHWDIFDDFFPFDADYATFLPLCWCLLMLRCSLFASSIFVFFMPCLAVFPSSCRCHTLRHCHWFSAGFRSIYAIFRFRRSLFCRHCLILPFFFFFFPLLRWFSPFFSLRLDIFLYWCRLFHAYAPFAVISLRYISFDDVSHMLLFRRRFSAPDAAIDCCLTLPAYDAHCFLRRAPACSFARHFCCSVSFFFFFCRAAFVTPLDLRRLFMLILRYILPAAARFVHPAHRYVFFFFFIERVSCLMPYAFHYTDFFAYYFDTICSCCCLSVIVFILHADAAPCWYSWVAARRFWYFYFRHIIFCLLLRFALYWSCRVTAPVFACHSADISPACAPRHVFFYAFLLPYHGYAAFCWYFVRCHAYCLLFRRYATYAIYSYAAICYYSFIVVLAHAASARLLLLCFFAHVRCLFIPRYLFILRACFMLYSARYLARRYICAIWVRAACRRCRLILPMPTISTLIAYANLSAVRCSCFTWCAIYAVSPRLFSFHAMLAAYAFATMPDFDVSFIICSIILCSFADILFDFATPAYMISRAPCALMFLLILMSLSAIIAMLIYPRCWCFRYGAMRCSHYSRCRCRACCRSPLIAFMRNAAYAPAPPFRCRVIFTLWACLFFMLTMLHIRRYALCLLPLRYTTSCAAPSSFRATLFDVVVARWGALALICRVPCLCLLSRCPCRAYKFIIPCHSLRYFTDVTLIISLVLMLTPNAPRKDAPRSSFYFIACLLPPCARAMPWCCRACAQALELRWRYLRRRRLRSTRARKMFLYAARAIIAARYLCFARCAMRVWAPLMLMPMPVFADSGAARKDLRWCYAATPRDSKVSRAMFFVDFDILLLLILIFFRRHPPPAAARR